MSRQNQNKKTKIKQPGLKTFQVKQNSKPADNKYFTLVLLAAFLVCVISVTTYKIEDDDFFWHLSTGKFITENGYVPDKDVFGYAAQNTQWIPFEWGSDAVFYNIYKASGYNGIFIFRSLIFCLIFLVYFRLLSLLKVSPVLNIMLLFVLLMALFDRFSPRPHIFTYLFISGLIYMLFTYKYIDRSKYFRRLYILPLVFLIWGNLHPGVLIGLLLFFVFLLSEFIIYKYPLKFSPGKTEPVTAGYLKKTALIFLGSASVLFINPHGIKTYFYIYSHTRMKMLEQIAEWLSPFNGIIDDTFVITLYKILLFSGLIVLVYSYKKRDVLFALLYTVFSVYSLRAIRFIVDYELVIIPLLAISINYYLQNIKSKKSAALTFKFFYGNIPKAVLIAVLIFLSFRFQSDDFYISLKYNREAGTGISGRYFPLELYKFIKTRGVSGIPFNNFDTGGYMHWEFPEQKIFIDSRNISDEIFNEYFSILKMQPGFEAKLEKYSMDYAVFFEPKLSRYPNIMKQQITEYFFNSPKWALVYWDDLSMLFLKRTQQNSELISGNEYKIINPYTAVFNQKQFESNVKNFPVLADNEMKRKASEEPNGFYYLGINDIVRKVLLNK